MIDTRDSGAANADQIEYWNSGPGAKWVAFQEKIDACFLAVKARLLERAAVEAGERVLDIGCGTGATTMELASRVEPDGHVLGVDVARPLLDKARARAAQAGIGNLRFVLSDAQTHGFDPGAFDLMTSRFGVMFFSDPVAAFGNIAAALRAGGRMAFVSWAALQGNPWFQIPADAAIARLGAPAPAPSHAPGPMAFQDIGHVSDILSRAGLSDISADAEELRLVVPGTVDEVAKFASNLGPVARIVKERGGSPADVDAIARDLARKFADYAIEGAVSVPATLNFFNAARR